MRELLRHPVVRENEAEQDACRQQQAKVAHGAHGGEKRVFESTDAQAANCECQDSGQQGCHRRRLGGRCNAGVDRYRDDQANEENRTKSDQKIA